MQVIFVENNRLPEYYSGDIAFSEFGQSDELPDGIALNLKAKFPDAFRIFSDEGIEIEDGVRFEPELAEEPDDTPKIRIQFVAGDERLNQLGDSYHSPAIEFEDREIHEISVVVAEILLRKFPQNFIIVDGEMPVTENVEKCQWVTVRGNQCKRLPVAGSIYCNQHATIADQQEGIGEITVRNNSHGR